MEFIKEHMELIFGIVVVGLFLFKAVTALMKARKIDEEGQETDAVVSRIEENWDPDGASSTYTTYVKYHDENGAVRESPVSMSATVEYQEGEQIRIRFIPGHYDLVRAVR